MATLFNYSDFGTLFNYLDDNDGMADISYDHADERARDARRAGLQAKKDEQPANTTRSYRSKQEEWKVCQLADRSLFMRIS